MYQAIEQFDLQKKGKLDKWSEKKRTSRMLLDRIRHKVGSLKFKLKPRNKNEIDERMDEVQVNQLSLFVACYVLVTKEQASVEFQSIVFAPFRGQLNEVRNR
jgi:hypothetical protein